MRLSVAAIVTCLAIVGVSAAQNATAAMRKPTNIPAQPLGAALEVLAKERDLQVIYRSDLVGGLQSAGAVGVFTPEQALGTLLAGTGLTYRYLNETTVTITRVSTGTPTSTSAPGSSTMAPSSPADNGDQKSGGSSLWDRFLAAQTAVGQTASSPAVEKKSAQTSENKAVQIEEVIVTAQKREERLQDVPVPVTAISADSLVDNNQVRIQDYYTQIPGLSFTPGLFGQPFLVIRGVTTGASSSANPPVGIMVDDTPYGSATGAGGGGFGAPDIDPSDLARIEVLRGPQGTLYGAASIGGLFKFVTVDPSTERLSGRLQADLSDAQHGDTPGYGVRGAINVPLGDTLAVRTSAFTRRDPGYIDNGQTGQKGINRTDVEGGHLSALWRPSDIFSLKLSALLQDSKAYGLPYADSTLGDLQQSFVLQRLVTQNQSGAYSATATAKLGGFNLTIVSGYSVNRAHSVYDYTPFIDAGLNQTFLGVSGTGTAYVIDHKTEKFTQEIRLEGPIAPRVDGLFGAFYTHENSPNVESILAVDPATGATAASWVNFIIPATFTEYALFADLTFHFTDQFDVQFGGRESRNRQTYFEEDIGPYDPIFVGVPSPVINPEVTTKDNAFTYLLTPRFKISPQLMAYARLATGYRPGGPNLSVVALAVPSHFDPDKASDYEIGMKGDVLDHVFSLDASLYYIDWKNLQIQLRDPVSNLVYYGNAGRAKSEGLELSVVARPAMGLAITAWGAWNYADLTESFPVTGKTYGASGDRLPFSARFSGNFSVDQEAPLTSALTGFAGASWSYVGDRKGAFRGASGGVPLPRQDLPSYSQVDLRTGIKHDSWTVSLNASNILNKRGVLIGGLGFIYSTSYAYIQPRTIGISVARTF